MKKSVLAVVLGLAFAGSVLACDANGGHKTTTPSAPAAPSTPAPTK